MPCDFCKNVLGRCAEFEDDYLVHIFSTNYDKLDRHTPESFAAAVDQVRDAAINRPAQLKIEQQSTGLKWDPDSLIFDPVWLAKLRPPECEFVDWMHHFVASGGLAQYEMNGLVCALEDTLPNFSATDIDTWVSAVQRPKGMTPIRRSFFATRIVRRVGAHDRAFASEVLTAVVMLGFSLDVMVRPLAEADAANYEELLERLACFDLLRVILTILTRGDIKDWETFRDALYTHTT